jgi:phosphotransferase system enzyme I (PtsI)
MSDAFLTGSALLTNAVGLHARPSVKLTQVAKRFGSSVEFALAPAGPWADAKSPVKVMRAKAAKGSTLHFRVRGPDGPEALAAMVALVERRFDETDDHAAAGPGHQRRLKGRPASPGSALGPIVVVGEPVAAAPRNSTGDPRAEAEALRAALSDALADLRRLAASASGDASEVIGFQVAFLEDAALAERAFAAIAGGRAAHDAWLETMAAEMETYLSSEDEYFRARVADVTDIRDRVHGHLLGSAPEAPVPPGSIVAATDLAPSRFLAIDWSRGGALVLTGGSPTSHVALLARARGIPALVSLGVPLSMLRGEGLVNASAGLLVIDPGPEERAAHARTSLLDAEERTASRRLARTQARTRDGTAIRVLLNVSDLSELDDLDPHICDGVGLVRTELLFQGALQDEEKQLAAYRRIVAWAAGRPVTVRTLDAGGDKPLPGLTLEHERNPFLGVRGLRLSFAAPEIFRTQLRALARAAAEAHLKVMLPMVTSPSELERARVMFAVEVSALRATGVAARLPSLGIMVEVPAAAITADLFDADFFSIGSNDLSQYVAAAGRDTAAVAELADPTQPAMLRLVRHVVDSAAARGVEVSLCGEAGADPAAIPLLLGAGLRTLSVAPALVGRAKLAIASVDLREAQGGKPWPG